MTKVISIFRFYANALKIVTLSDLAVSVAFTCEVHRVMSIPFTGLQHPHRRVLISLVLLSPWWLLCTLMCGTYVVWSLLQLDGAAPYVLYFITMSCDSTNQLFIHPFLPQRTFLSRILNSRPASLLPCSAVCIMGFNLVPRHNRIVSESNTSGVLDLKFRVKINIHPRVDKTTSVVSLLSQMSPVLAFSHPIKIHFNIILHSTTQSFI
jgi:hypothetical protein